MFKQYEWDCIEKRPTMADDTSLPTDITRRKVVAAAGAGLASLAGCSEHIPCDNGLACPETPYQEPTRSDDPANTPDSTPTSSYDESFVMGSPDINSTTSTLPELTRYPRNAPEETIDGITPFKLGLHRVPVDISRLKTTVTLPDTSIRTPIQLTLHIPTDTTTPAPPANEQTYKKITREYTPETPNFKTHTFEFAHGPLEIPANISYTVYVSIDFNPRGTESDRLLTYQPFIRHKYDTPSGETKITYRSNNGLVYTTLKKPRNVWQERYDEGRVTFFLHPFHSRPRAGISHSTLGLTEKEEVEQAAEEVYRNPYEIEKQGLNNGYSTHAEEMEHVDERKYLSSLADSAAGNLEKLGITHPTDIAKEIALIPTILPYKTGTNTSSDANVGSEHTPSYHKLYHMRGDCSDKSYLFVKLLHSENFNLDTAAIGCTYQASPDAQPAGHAIAGIAEEHVEPDIDHGYWRRTSDPSEEIVWQTADNGTRYALLECTAIRPIGGVGPRYDNIREETLLV